jgi:hypothetical protein
MSYQRMGAYCLLAGFVALASCSNTADPPDPVKLKAAGWVQLGSDRTANVWVLTTTYYCEQQMSVECPPGQDITSREQVDVYGSKEMCDAEVAREHDIDAKTIRGTAGLYTMYRDKALKGQYVPPSWLLNTTTNPHVTCEHYRVKLQSRP